MDKPLFRIDDIGASTKHFNQHGKKWFTFFGRKVLYVPFANVWFFKKIWPFRQWGVYDELTVREWKEILTIFNQYHIVPIIAVTATWVERNGSLTPFPEKFPEEAEFLKKAASEAKVVIANHGLTHCVVGKHLPRFWGSNRKFHREFLPHLDEIWHKEHVVRSQKILEDFFGREITIFVPPGNLWSKRTYEALKGTHITKVLCNNYMTDTTEPMQGITFFADREGCVAFHDRELKLYGGKWLEQLIKRYL